MTSASGRTRNRFNPARTLAAFKVAQGTEQSIRASPPPPGPGTHSSSACRSAACHPDGHLPPSPRGPTGGHPPPHDVHPPPPNAHRVCHPTAHTPHPAHDRPPCTQPIRLAHNRSPCAPPSPVSPLPAVPPPSFSSFPFSPSPSLFRCVWVGAERWGAAGLSSAGRARGTGGHPEGRENPTRPLIPTSTRPISRSWGAPPETGRRTPLSRHPLDRSSCAARPRDDDRGPASGCCAIPKGDPLEAHGRRDG